jgi:serine/threonine protein phosphatase PrpC
MTLVKISTFTHPGSLRPTQQDAVLVNGEKLNEGSKILENQKEIKCFVADGVAGSSDGAFASKFVLEEISGIEFSDIWEENLIKLREINHRLIRINAERGQNSATTLCGVFLKEGIIQVFQSGDTELYLIREGKFIPLAAVHNESVENIKKKYPGISLEQAYEKAANTLTSFWGSQVDRLVFDKDWKRRISLPAIDGIKSGDQLLICSDGLFKCMNKREFYEIINSDLNSNLEEELLKIIGKNKAPDNLSFILLENF